MRDVCDLVGFSFFFFTSLCSECPDLYPSKRISAMNGSIRYNRAMGIGIDGRFQPSLVSYNRYAYS